jgi:hypothetical protein
VRTGATAANRRSTTRVAVHAVTAKRPTPKTAAARKNAPRSHNRMSSSMHVVGASTI